MSPETVTKDAIQTRVYAALEEFGADASELAPDATFESLDVDSLDLVELGQIVQEEYGVELKGEDMPKLKTVGDAVDLIAERAGA
ncbi:MAG: acyl carrier protein [Solirubrobacteraceae bacterium]